MIVESPSVISGRAWRARVRLLLFAGTVVGAMVVIVAMAAWLANRGDMVAFATFSDVSVTDPTTNLGESPVLQTLKQFGFNIYSGPGP